MLASFEQVTKEALDLPPRQRLALAGFLLESTEAGGDPEAESAWDSEIIQRVLAIDDGKVKAVSYADVMREADKRLMP